MAYRNKYMLMNKSDEMDEFGNNYPDIATFPINTFTPTSKGRPVFLNENIVYRFDNASYSYYTEFSFYDDINLWLNDIPYLSDDSYVGTTLLFYQKRELDQFFIANLKGTR